MAEAFEWSCQSCKEPIADGEGFFELFTWKVREYREAVKAWETEHPGRSHSLAELLSLPDVPHWRILHFKCNPTEEEGYWFAIERMRTPEQMLSWTAHLMDKHWFRDTNWSQVIYLQKNKQNWGLA